MTARTQSLEFRHAPLVIAGKVVASLAAGVWMVIAARELSVGDFADLALVTALVAIAVQLADAGISVELPKAVVASKGRFHAHVEAGTRRRLRASVPVAAAAMAAFLVAAADASLLVAAGFMLSTVATATYGAVTVGLRAMRRYRAEALVDPAARLVFLTVALIAVRLGADLEFVAFVYGGVDLLTAAAYRAAVRRVEASESPSVTLGPFRPSHLAMPLAAVYWRVDTWILALLSDVQEVALYGASYRLLDASLLPALVISSMIPGRVLEVAPAERAHLARRWAAISVLTTTPFAVVAAVAAPEVLDLLFGEGFAEGATALRWLGAAGLVSAGVLVLTSALATLDTGRYFRAIVIVSVLTIAADLALLGRFGAEGAAAVTLVGQAALGVLLWRALRQPPHRDARAGVPMA